MVTRSSLFVTSPIMTMMIIKTIIILLCFEISIRSVQADAGIGEKYDWNQHYQQKSRFIRNNRNGTNNDCNPNRQPSCRTSKDVFAFQHRNHHQYSQHHNMISKNIQRNWMYPSLLLPFQQQSYQQSLKKHFRQQRQTQSLSSTTTTLKQQLLSSSDYNNIENLIRNFDMNHILSLLFVSLSFVNENAAPLLTSSSISIWIVRTLSIVLLYISFILYWDRPRGILNVILNDDIIVAPSINIPNGGLGLYANKDIKVGTILGTYPGVIYPMQQNVYKLSQYPHCESCTWRFSDNNAVIDPTNSVGVLDAICYGGNSYYPGSMLMWQTLSSIWNVSTALCRINEPPKGYDVNVITIEDRSKRIVTLVLERDVVVGEELYMDYGLTYDRSMYGNAPTNSNNQTIDF